MEQERPENEPVDWSPESAVDPVVRCDSCKTLVKVETLHKIGSCDKCGNRRVRNILVFNEEERKQLEEWGFSDFLRLFEVKEES